MKRFALFCLLLLAVISTSVAQSIAYEYSFKTKSWTPVVAQPFGSLTEVPLFGSLDMSLVGGADGGLSGPVTFGGLLSKSFPLAKQLMVTVGVTSRIVTGRPPQFGGIVLGVALKL